MLANTEILQICQIRLLPSTVANIAKQGPSNNYVPQK
jgi:hypothetical protein